jgi:hypothetical protein
MPAPVLAEMKKLTELLRILDHGGSGQDLHDGLTLPELGALVVVAGKEAGLRVKTEMRVGRGRIDCGWFSAERIIVAWELDGSNVRREHLFGSHRRLGTFPKLERSGAPIRIQALYGIRSGRHLGTGHIDRPDVRQSAQEKGISIWPDVQLLRGKLLDIARDAAERAR